MKKEKRIIRVLTLGNRSKYRVVRIPKKLYYYDAPRENPNEI